MRLRTLAAGLTTVVVMAGVAVATAGPAAAEGQPQQVVRTQEANEVRALRIEHAWKYGTDAEKKKVLALCAKLGAGGLKTGKWISYRCTVEKKVVLLEVWNGKEKPTLTAGEFDGTL